MQNKVMPLVHKAKIAHIEVIKVIVVEKTVCSRLVFLIGEDLLTTLAASHAILLLLASFGRRELLGLLRALDLVALDNRLADAITDTVCAYHSIKFLLFIVVLVRESFLLLVLKTCIVDNGLLVEAKT